MAGLTPTPPLPPINQTSLILTIAIYPVDWQVRAGVFWVNAHHRNDPSTPWGGFKESGIGRENGWEAFRE